MNKSTSDKGEAVPRDAGTPARNGAASECDAEFAIIPGLFSPFTFQMQSGLLKPVGLSQQ